ncbi:hypothetical protein HYR99_36510 [Candidatus Poribacteria bacterium]|nr:hypothetical protein [Candidatus Poribacteria bacterium]
MSDIAKMVEALQELSEAETRQVLGFITELKYQPGSPKPGSVDAVMRSFGSWKMTPEEYEQFMKDIADCRFRTSAV